MIAQVKAISDIHLQQNYSRNESLHPTSNSILMKNKHQFQCRSENYISANEQNLNETILSSSATNDKNQFEIYCQRFLAEHYPIVNVREKNKFEFEDQSSNVPSVPKQADSFLHRLMKSFFSISSRPSTKKKRTKRIDGNLKTKTISESSNIGWNFFSNQNKIKERSKVNPIKENNQKSSAYQKLRSSTCRRHEKVDESNQTLSMNNSQMKGIETRRSTKKTSTSAPWSKRRVLTDAQRHKIIVAIETIFDAMLSTYSI